MLTTKYGDIVDTLAAVPVKPWLCAPPPPVLLESVLDVVIVCVCPFPPPVDPLDALEVVML